MVELPVNILLLFILLQFKHCICDYFLQIPPVGVRKDKLFSFGALSHMGIHMVGTALSLLACGINILYSLVEVLHWLIDCMKTTANRRYSINIVETPNRFWILNGVDQLLHQLTYIGLIIWLIQ